MGAGMYTLYDWWPIVPPVEPSTLYSLICVVSFTGREPISTVCLAFSCVLTAGFFLRFIVIFLARFRIVDVFSYAAAGAGSVVSDYLFLFLYPQLPVIFIL